MIIQFRGTNYSMTYDSSEFYSRSFYVANLSSGTSIPFRAYYNSSGTITAMSEITVYNYQSTSSSIQSVPAFNLSSIFTFLIIIFGGLFLR